MQIDEDSKVLHNIMNMMNLVLKRLDDIDEKINYETILNQLTYPELE